MNNVAQADAGGSSVNSEGVQRPDGKSTPLTPHLERCLRDNGSSPFGRFINLLASWAGSTSATRCVNESSSALFPSHLPFACDRGVPIVASSVRHPSRGRIELLARRWVNKLIALHSFYALGSPKDLSGVAEKLGPYRIRSAVMARAEALLPEARAFARACEVTTMSPKADGLLEIAERLRVIDNDSYFRGLTDALEPATTVADALFVNDTNVDMPPIAGKVRPADHLSPERAHVVSNLPDYVLKPKEEWDVAVVPCTRIENRSRRRLHARMLRAGLTALVGIEDVPVDPSTGRPIAGGLFGTGKKNKKLLRLVFDRRPQNAQERRLRWARLPQPAQVR